MTKKLKQTRASATTKVFAILAAVAGITLLAMGGLGLWAHAFTTDMVRTELAAQKIYFPPKGSPAFSPEEYPDIQKYAGQQVDTGEEARAYANGFIGRHLKKVAGGKVYAEVSAEAMKDPTNQKLQAQKQTLFQGETLRGMLLGNGYAFGTIGRIAKFAAVVAIISSLLMFALAIALGRYVYGRR